MSLRPPSNLRAYDDFYTGDPAIVALPPNASDDEKKDRENRIRVARETGDWSGVIVEGQRPTKFKMHIIGGDAYRTLMDEYSAKQIGLGKLTQLAFLLAVRDVTDLGDTKVERKQTARYGWIADVEIADALDAIDIGIVNELGGEALRRARELSPKS